MDKNDNLKNELEEMIEQMDADSLQAEPAKNTEDKVMSLLDALLEPTEHLAIDDLDFKEEYYNADIPIPAEIAATTPVSNPDEDAFTEKDKALVEEKNKRKDPKRSPFIPPKKMDDKASLMAQYSSIMGSPTGEIEPKKKSFWGKLPFKNIFSKRRSEETDIEESEEEDEENISFHNVNDGSFDYSNTIDSQSQSLRENLGGSDFSYKRAITPLPEELDVKAEIARKLAGGRDMQKPETPKTYDDDDSKTNPALDINEIGTSVFNLSDSDFKTSELLRTTKAGKKSDASSAPLDEPQKGRGIYSAGESLLDTALADIDLSDLGGQTFDSEASLSDEFEKMEDKAKKFAQLDRQISSEFIVCIGLLITSFLSLLLNLSLYNLPLPLPAFTDPIANPGGFIIVNIVLLLISVSLFSKTLIKTIAGLLKIHINAETMIFLGSTFTLIQLISMRSSPELLRNSNVHIYSSVFIFSMFFITLASLIKYSYTKANFRIVSSEKQKYSLEFFEKPVIESQVISLIGNPDVLISSPVKTGFLRRFFEFSLYENDSFYQISFGRILYGVSFIISVLIFLVSMVISDSIAESFSLWIGMIAAISPFAAVLYQVLPMRKSAAHLLRKGAFISNTNAMHDYGGTSAVIIPAEELFPKGAVELQGMRTFEDGRIDEAIMDMAAVSRLTGSALAPIFMKMIMNKAEILPVIDSVEYIENAGIIAWSKGRRILIGNRELMAIYQVEAPSVEYEEKYKIGERDLIYIAHSGVLRAMYVVKYKTEKSIKRDLLALIGEKIDIILHTSDPNITSEKIANLFSLPLSSVHMMSEKLMADFESANRPRKKSNAFVGSFGGLKSYLASVITAIKLSGAISSSRFILIAGVILAQLIVAGFGILGGVFTGLTQISPITITLFHVFSLLVIYLINRFTRL